LNFLEIEKDFFSESENQINVKKRATKGHNKDEKDVVKGMLSIRRE